MTFVEKYNLSITDILGSNWVISIRLDDYAGDVYSLVGTDDPLTIDYDGDEDDPYDPIRSSKATVNIKMDDNCLLLVDDLQDIDDATVFVDITSDTGQHVSGFVVPDQFSKGLSTIDGSITLTTQDFFVLMKGVSAYNADGSIIYGKVNLYLYLQQQFNAALSGTDALEFNIINPYSLYPDGDSRNDDYANFFDQLGTAAEGFNTSNGRPDTAYNIAEKLFTSFLSTSFLEGNKVNIICPNGLNTTSYKTVYIKGNTRTSEFLDNNDEQISFARGAKEVSAEMKFDTSNGLFVNPFFRFWTDNLPDNWDATDAVGLGWVTATKVANYRSEALGGAKLQLTAAGYAEDSNVKLASQVISQTVSVTKGWSYTVTYNMTYQDYSAWHSGTDTTDDTPSILIYIYFKAENGQKYVYNSNNEWGDPASGGSPYFGLESSLNSQSHDVDLPPVPNSGTIEVILTTAGLDGSYYKVSASSLYKTAVIYNSVIISTSNVGSGQTDYLTQVKNYTLKADKADIYLQTGILDNVAGALFDCVPNRGGSYNFDLLDANTIYNGSETVQYSLLHQFVRAKMAMQRTARRKIDFTVVSNTIKFSDLIKFDDETGIEGVYMQLTRSYDVINAKQKIRVIEINPQFLPDIDASTLTDDDTNDYPNATTDLYEHYNTTA